MRNSETDRMLADMSVERLREASRDKIRVGVLTANGITNVSAVLRNENRLEKLDGIGAASANRILLRRVSCFVRRGGEIRTRSRSGVLF